MSQPSLFDPVESTRRKVDGMRTAATTRSSDLELAREIARELCQRNGTTHADAVIEELYRRTGIASLGNAAGSIFAGREFIPTNQFVRSERPQAHSNLLRVWRAR